MMKVLILLILTFGIGNIASVWAQSTKSTGLLAYTQILDVVEQQDDIWFSCNKALFKVNKKTLQYQCFTTQNSILPSNHIQTISTDQYHNLWIGTYDLALLKIDKGGNWDSIPYPRQLNNTTLPHYEVYSSDVDPNTDVLWLGTSIGLLNYDGSKWQLITDANCPTASSAIWDLEIENDMIYIASYTTLTYDIKANKWDDHAIPSNGPLASITAPKIARYGSKDLFYMFSTPIPELAYKAPTDFSSWEIWTAPQGLNQNPNKMAGALPLMPNKNLTLQATSNNRLYYNTPNNILVYYDGTRWKQDFLVPNNNINLSIIDFFYIAQDGSFWLFEEHKLVHYDPKSHYHHSITLNPYRSHGPSTTARFANPEETNQEAAIELMLFPNPATHSLSLKHDLGKFDRLHVMSATGASVLELNPNQTTINISQLPNGIYWMIAEQQDTIHKVAFIKEN